MNKKSVRVVVQIALHLTVHLALHPLHLPEPESLVLSTTLSELLHSAGQSAWQRWRRPPR